MFQKRNHNIHWLCQLGVYVLSRRYAIPIPIVSQSIRPCMQFNHGFIWRIRRAVPFFVLSLLSSSPKQRDGNHTSDPQTHTHTHKRDCQNYQKVKWWLANLLYSLQCNNENFLSLSSRCNAASVYGVVVLSPTTMAGNGVLRKGVVVRRTGTRWTDVSQPGYAFVAIQTTWSTNNQHPTWYRSPFVPPRCKRSIDLYMQTAYIYILYTYI